MRDIAASLDAFLPYPVYEFKGGPIDGQQVKVDLIDLGDLGYAAPDLWNVRAELPSLLPQPNLPGSIPVNSRVLVATYRFVRTRGRNIGFYEYVSER